MAQDNETLVGVAYRDTYAVSQAVSDWQAASAGDSSEVVLLAGLDVASNQVTAVAVARALLIDDLVTVTADLLRVNQALFDAPMVRAAFSEVIARYQVLHQLLPTEPGLPLSGSDVAELLEQGGQGGPALEGVIGGRVGAADAAVRGYASGGVVLAAENDPLTVAYYEALLRYVLFGHGDIVRAVAGASVACDRAGSNGGPSCEDAGADGAITTSDLGRFDEYLLAGGPLQAVDSDQSLRVAQDVGGAVAAGNLSSAYDRLGRHLLDVLLPAYDKGADENGDGRIDEDEYPNRYESGHTREGIIDTAVADSVSIVQGIEGADANDPEGSSGAVLDASMSALSNQAGETPAAVVAAVEQALTDSDPAALTALINDLATGGQPEVGNDQVSEVRVAVSGTLSAACSLSAAPLNFGQIERGVLSGPAAAEAFVDVACTPGVEFVLSNTTGELELDIDGAGGAQTSVSLYRDAGHSQRFGSSGAEVIRETQTLQQHENGGTEYGIFGRLHDRGNRNAAPQELGDIDGHFVLQVTF